MRVRRRVGGATQKQHLDLHSVAPPTRRRTERAEASDHGASRGVSVRDVKTGCASAAESAAPHRSGISVYTVWRRRPGGEPSEPKHLITVRRVGYRFVM